MPDKEKVVKALNEAIPFAESRGYGGVAQAMHDAVELLKEQETVVRCKDCVYYNSEPDCHGDYCDKIHWSKGPDWFCADGVRR